MDIAAFAIVIAIYRLVLYLAQASIGWSARNRYAYYLATGIFAAGFFLSTWLTHRMRLSVELSLAIILAFPALLNATAMSRLALVAIWTGRVLGRRWSRQFQARRYVVYDKHVNPNMYAFGVTALSFLTFGPAILWFWIVARALGWK